VESNREVALQKLRGLIFGFSITRSIAVAAELGIADKLTDRPGTAELAAECGVLERPLYRVLRACWRRRLLRRCGRSLRPHGYWLGHTLLFAGGGANAGCSAGGAGGTPDPSAMIGRSGPSGNASPPTAPVSGLSNPPPGFDGAGSAKPGATTTGNSGYALLMW
jgi:hypothetical protein